MGPLFDSTIPVPQMLNNGISTGRYSRMRTILHESAHYAKLLPHQFENGDDAKTLWNERYVVNYCDSLLRTIDNNYPKITKVSPSHAHVGDTIAIEGTKFNPQAVVEIGGVEAPRVGFEVLDASQARYRIRVTVPAVGPQGNDYVVIKHLTAVPPGTTPEVVSWDTSFEGFKRDQ